MQSTTCRWCVSQAWGNDDVLAFVALATTARPHVSTVSCWIVMIFFYPVLPYQKKNETGP